MEQSHGYVLRAKSSPAFTDDGRLLPTVGVEEEAVGSVGVRREGEGGPGATNVWRQRPHDGVVATEAVAVVVIVDDGHLDRHAVEVDHAVDHGRCLGRRHA